MRNYLTASVVAVTLLGVWRPAQAQLVERRHNGFWIGFGVGIGRNYNTALDGSEIAGEVGYLRMGGTPNEQILIGGEINGWTHTDNGVSLTRGNGTFTVLFYPIRRGDLFLKGGLGVGSMQVSDGVGVTSQNGAGETLGIGYDIRLGDNIYLTPNADVLYQQVTIGGIQRHNTIGELSIGLTWH